MAGLDFRVFLTIGIVYLTWGINGLYGLFVGIFFEKGFFDFIFNIFDKSLKKNDINFHPPINPTLN